MDDRALVAAAQQGDRASLDQLLSRHYDRIFAVCRRVTGHDADAADAAQEALIAIVRSLNRFDGRSSFATWTYRIATNSALDELRRRRRRPELATRTDIDGSVTGLGEPVDPDSGLRLDSIADRSVIDEALAKLPEDFRVPVILRDVADLDYAEIAAVLNIPAGTVKSRIARGRAALAQSLGLAFPGNQHDPNQRPSSAP